MTGNEDKFRKLINQGHSAAWDQDWARAAEYYRHALAEKPDDPQCLINLGLAMYELHIYEDALKYYLKATKVLPDDPIPLEKAADIYERQGLLDRACEITLRAAELFAKNNDLAKAIESLTRVIANDPGNIIAHARLAYIYERLGKTDISVKEYIAVASLYQNHGQIDKAISAASHALELAPGDKSATHALRQIKENRLLPIPVAQKGSTGPLRMLKIRQLESAEGNRTESLDPIIETRQNALRILAGMLFDMTESSETSNPESEKDLKRKLTNTNKVFGGAAGKPDKARIAHHLGQVIDYQTRGEEKEAAEGLEKAAEAGIDHPALYFDLGLLKAKGDRTQSAIRSLKRALPYKEFVLASNLLLGQIYYKMGRSKEASMYYLEALRWADAEVVPQVFADDLRQLYEPLLDSLSREKNEQTHNLLCQNVENLLVRAGWREHIKEARRQLPDPETGGLLTPLAELLTSAESGRLVNAMANIRHLAEQGCWRSAMEEAFWVLQDAYAYLPLHTYMADLLFEQGFVEEAIAKMNVVAKAYKIRGENKRAIEILKRIIDISPMDTSSREDLIQELITDNEMEKAVKVMMDLADVYYDMADLSKARRTYTEALRLAQQSNLDETQKINILHQMADIDVQSLDWRQAMVVYKQIRTLSPADEKANSKLIELNLRLGQQTQAVAELDQFLAYLIENQKVDQALSNIKRLVEDHCEQEFIRKRLIDLFRQLGRSQEAIEFLDDLSVQLISVDDKENAIKLIQTILKLKPPHPETYRQIITSLEKP